jgi:choline dehydrogenase
MECWQRGPDDFRGGSGPICVVEQTDRGAANMAYLEACRQAGYSRNPDYNGAVQEGVSITQVNHRRGVRSQASREYLRRVAVRDQITVRTKAIAHRVLLDRSRAVGVEYRHRGALMVARARQEVILSAGALASPRLLMLSGIGPRDALLNVGLEVRHELPGVGRNLQEHPYLMQRWFSRGVATFNRPRLGMLARGLADYIGRGAGILAMTIVQVQCMTRTDPQLPTPDLQLQFTPFAITRDVDENGMFTVQPAKQEGFLASSTFLKPRARGTVGLRSSSADAPPLITYQFLADQRDLRDVLRGLREVQRVMGQPAMKEITGGQFAPESACRTDSDWEAYARTQVTPSYHPVGTCRMGVDDEAVVDPELRVHGLAGLRVVDASVMPTITTGNTNAPAMMIGERAAELISSRAGHGGFSHGE